MTEIFVCPWCGCLTPKFHGNQKYCHPDIKNCRAEARKETKRKTYQKHREKYYAKYVEDTIGQSRLGSHRSKDYEKEYKMIQKEKRRLKL